MSNICIHGQLRRSCEICDLEQQLAAKDAEIAHLQSTYARFKDLLRQIAYPRRGTDEEKMGIFDAAKLIQANFTMADLDDPVKS